MTRNTLKLIEMSITILLIMGVFYDGYLLQRCKQELTQINIKYDYIIQQTKVTSSDSLTLDTAKIKYINTEENEENKGTKERKRKAKGTYEVMTTPKRGGMTSGL